jgi:hypothetical protein
MARALYTDFDALPHRERNLARYLMGIWQATALHR